MKKKILVLIPTIAIDGDFFLRTYSAMSKVFDITIVTPYKIWLPRYGIATKTLDLQKIQKTYPHITVIGLNVIHPTNALLQTIYPWLYGVIKKCRPDSIHCYTEIFSPILSQVGVYARMIDPRITIVNYSTENLDRTKRFPHRMFGFFNAKYLKKVYALNEEAEVEVQKFGIKKKDIVRFWLGVDFANFTFVPHTLGDKKSLRIGFVGRLVEEKWVISLLEALEILGPQYHLEIIGTWPQEDSFKEFVRTEGLEDQVTFVWKVESSVLKHHFKQFDVLVVPSLSTPSRKEQFGRVIAESMASGVPVIGSSSGAIPEVIGEHGLIFEEGNSEDLAEKIQSMVSDTARYEKFVEGGYHYALKHYSQEAFEKNLSDLYNAL